MALVLADRVRDTTTTTGTGTVTLSGTAPTGYQNFSVVGNGNTTYYTINAGSQWEVGIGTYSSTGPTLSRDTVLSSSSSGSLVDFSAGTKDVFVTYPSGKSVYQDATGNVGIGTTTPNYPVDVQRNSATSEILRVRNDTVAAAALITARGGGGGTVDFGSGADASTFVIRTAATERMRITDTGNVGIGTTAPTKTLMVSSGGTSTPAQGGLAGVLIANTDLTASGTSGITGALADPGGTGRHAAAIAFGKDGTWTAGAAYPGNIQFWTRPNSTADEVERMRIDSSGNVGIGTTTPESILHVQYTGANSTILRRYSSDANASNLNLQKSRGTPASPTIVSSGDIVGNVSFQGYDGSAFRTAATIYGIADGTPGASDMPGSLTFNTTPDGTSSVAERMRIDSSGNVGIGTTSPASLLHVKQSSDAIERYPSGTWAGRVINAADASTYNGLLVGNRWAASSSTVFEAGSIYGNGSLYWSSYYKIDGVGQHFWGYGASGLEGMRLNTSGNVGIGTSAPTFKLQVAGNFYTSSNVQFYDQDGFRFASAAAYTSMRIGSSYTGETTGEIAFDRTNGAFTYKAGTTGSALSEFFRITGTGNVGIGTNAPSSILHTVAVGSEIRSENTSTAQYQSGRVRLKGPAGTYRSTNLVHGNDNVGGTNTYFAIEGANSSDNYLQTLALYNYASQYWLFSTSNTERMRIASTGNVGINTSTPSTNLEVNGGLIAGSENRQTHPNVGPVGFKAQWNYTGGFGETDFYNLYSIASDSFRFYQSTGNGTAQLLYDIQPSNHIWYTGGSERMRITSAGDVGIGTSSPVAKLDVAGDLIGSGNNIVGSNLYYDYSQVRWEYRANGFGGAVKLAEASVGSIEFFTASNNTSGAGAAATPNLRMVITNSGDVGVGTTAPQSKMEIRATSGGSVFNALTLSNYVGASVNTGVALYFDPNGAGSLARAASIQSVQSTSGNYADLRFFTANSDTPAERMRISSGGYVAIGNSNAAPKFSVTLGTGFSWGGGWGAGSAVFGGNGAASGAGSGGLAITYDDTDGGTIGPVIPGVAWKPLRLFSDTLQFYTNGATERMRITSGGDVGIGATSLSGKLHVETTSTGDVIYIAANTGGTAGQSVYVIPVRTAGTLRGGIQWNGTNLLYNNSSDRRLKSNIADADDAASLIDAIQVRKFDWKESGNHQRYGFIAQELIAVAPEAVHQPEDENEMMGVDYSKLVPMLVKELQSLRARVAELEGK